MNNNIFDIFNTGEHANQHPFFEFHHDKDFKLENDDISTKSPYSYEFNDTSADQDNYQKFLNLNNVNDFDKTGIDPSNESCFLQQQLDKKNLNMIINQQQHHLNYSLNQNSLKQQNQNILLEQNTLQQTQQQENSPITQDDYHKQMQAYNKMIEKSKRIQKREKAKNRQKNQKKVKEQQELQEKNQVKQEINSNYKEENHPQSGACSSDEDAIMPHSPTQNIKHDTASQMSSSDKIQIKIEEATTQSTTSAQGQQQQQNGQNVNFENIKDPKERKKQQQKIRNRISAQNSRDRKKLYIQNLESENNKLVGDYQMLQEQIKQLTYQNQALVKELEGMRNQLHNPKNYICGNCHDKSQISYTNDFMTDEIMFKNDMSTDISQNSPNSSPQRQSNQNNYNTRPSNMKFGFGGFALLGFMTICCIVTMLGNNNNVNSSESISLYKLPNLEKINAAKRNLVEQFSQPQEIKMEEEVVDVHPEIQLTMQQQNQKLDSTSSSENANYFKDWAKYRPWLIQIEKLRKNVFQVISDYFKDQSNKRDLSTQTDLSEQNKISLTDIPTMMNSQQNYQPKSFIQSKIVQSQANHAALSNQQLAPANYFNEKVSTLFCPSPYLYQSHQSKDSMNQLSQSEWIHLVVPQNNLQNFQLNGDDIMLKKNNTDQTLEQQNNAMIEMVCRVYKTREIYDDNQIISQNF